MNPREEIITALKKAVLESGYKEEPELESSSALEFGDYSSNIALKLKIDPSEIVKKIERPKSIEKIEVVKPGFINFWVSPDYLLKNIDKFTSLKKSSKGKIMVEFTDPNPFKLFHIGHLYSNIVGEAISRLLESSGAMVKRVNYQGDVGLHVAKSIYGIQKSKVKIQDLEKKSLSERIKFLSGCYTVGNKAYEENEKAKKEIIETNRKVYEKDKNIEEVYEKGKKWSLDYFEEIYKRLGTKFERYYFESEVGKVGLKLVKEYLKKGIFEESEGAIIFPGEKYGLHNRVFVNSQGYPTYEAKELGLAPTKYKDFPYDKSIIVTGNEINEYFKVVLSALSKIKPKLASKTIHVPHGMVRLSGGKMASRLGNIVSGESLLTDVKSKIKESFKDMDNATLEKVTIAAVKYALLRIRIGKDIEFDINQSISLDGDSGPYILYSYVRIQSVLANTGITLISNKEGGVLKEEDIMVIRLLSSFQDVVENSVSKLSPNILCSYLFELSHRFNLLYQKQRILGDSSRLKIAEATGGVIKNSLTILGIEAPQHM